MGEFNGSAALVQACIDGLEHTLAANRNPAVAAAAAKVRAA